MSVSFPEFLAFAHPGYQVYLDKVIYVLFTAQVYSSRSKMLHEAFQELESMLCFETSLNFEFASDFGCN